METLRQTSQAQGKAADKTRAYYRLVEDPVDDDEIRSEVAKIEDDISARDTGSLTHPHTKDSKVLHDRQGILNVLVQKQAETINPLDASVRKLQGLVSEILSQNQTHTTPTSSWAEGTIVTFRGEAAYNPSLETNMYTPIARLLIPGKVQSAPSKHDKLLDT